ncbi:MAG: PfkB family carbohydrate kinase [Rhodospirillales bacterium]
MARVLFIGEINVDILMGGMETPPVVDREVPCKTFEVAMGASTIISACAYASLGGEVSFAGLAGEDEYGEFMLNGLRGFGIDTSLVRRTREVRTGVTVNMICGSTRTQVTYPGTIEAYGGEGLEEAILARFNHVHFGGVYLETRLRPRIAGLLQSARSLGLTTSLDPQWDPSGRWECMDAWLPLLNYLFVNEDESLSITGGASAVEASRALAGRTACPVIKVGPRGAIIFDGGQPAAVPGFSVDVVDTTGAGDCFDAAFLFARLEKKATLREAARFANAVAARSCTFAGGTAARTTCEDAQALLSS